MSDRGLPAGMTAVGPLMLWSAVGIALLHTGSRAVVTNDLHVYLAQGRWMVENGALLTEEIFTWTAPGVEYVNGTWLFCVLSWLLHEAVGLEGLRLFNGLAVAATVVLVSFAARARGVDDRAASVAGLYAWFMMLQNTVIRGQTWVFPIFAAFVWLAGRPRRWWIALLGGAAAGALWNGLHGSFPAGIVWAGAAALGTAWDARDWRAGLTPALAGLGLALGACVGPYGPMIWTYIFDNSALPQQRGFTEWFPPDPRAFEGARFFGSIGLWLWLLGRNKQRSPTGDLLVLLGFAYLAVTGTRFVAWFGLATAVPLAVRLAAAMGPERGFPSRLMRPIYVLFAALWALLLGKGLAPPEGGSLDDDTPVALVDALEADTAEGRLLGPPEYGGYVATRLWPGWKHCGDIRTWIFDDEAWGIYVELSRAPEGWEDRLDELGVTHLLLWEAYHGQTLLPAARASERWELLAETEFGAAFRRKR
jgi:hypothetical protein